MFVQQCLWGFDILYHKIINLAKQDKHGTLERNERLSACHLVHDKRFGKSPFCEAYVTKTYSDGKPTQNISPQLTKWPFLHVHTGHVDFKVDLLSKSLVAEVARVRSLFKVHRPHMFVQHCLWGCYSSKVNNQFTTGTPAAVPYWEEKFNISNLKL